MTFLTDDSFKYYELGEFVAHNMLNGDIHPDMQLDNIGYRNNGQIVFTDFADVTQINIPNCLSADTCEQLTLSLLPIIEDIKDSFSKISCFRMGFIAMGGLLGHAIFLSTLNLGVSSSWYTKYTSSNSSYDLAFLYSDGNSKSLIKNWKKQSLDQITIEKYPTHDEYERSKNRFRILDANCYYMDILYYCRSYMGRSKILYINSIDENRDRQKYSVRDLTVSIIKSNCNLYIEKIADTALHHKHYYTAYGLYKKCLSEARKDGDEKNIKAAQNGLSSISKSAPISSSVCDFIVENLDCDLFELMWILDELDQSISISS